MMTIVPHKGVDAIEFNMTREEVARVMGQVPHRGRRTQHDSSDYDFFQQVGLFVYYDTSDRCHAIEFTRDATILYEGYELFAHPAYEVREWAQGQDPALEVKDGFVSPALGLSMYSPLIDEPDLDENERNEPAESFLIFRQGYYSNAEWRLEL